MAVFNAFITQKKSRKRALRTHKYTRYEIKDDNGLVEGEVFVKRTVDKKPFELKSKDTIYLSMK